MVIYLSKKIVSFFLFDKRFYVSRFLKQKRGVKQNTKSFNQTLDFSKWFKIFLSGFVFLF